ncbi:MAG TPA: glycosyltransferase family 4 protein [Longimicrobiaceae bacterium]|nr:glycosyltransferase family 4 protein [Longimicrobiaceae bacterium]
MIRVCVVAPRYMTGGQAIEARTIVSGFAGDPEYRLEMQPIDPAIPAWLARLRGVRTVARMPLYFFGLVRRIRRADVVHVFTAAFWPFLLTTTPAILLGRLMGRPVVLNYRDGRAPDHLPARWVRWVIARATVLVFPSGFLRDVFRGYGFEGEVISNVVHTERFRFRERVPLRPVLISSRLLEELYAVENTIRAFARVREVHSEARLLVIGDGDRAESLKRLVREEGIGGVEFHGAVPHDQVADWFDRADVFVNSSRDDNMPHSVIEAFSSGLAVVTTRAGGIPYIVEHGRNGLLVEIDDPVAMADAVLDLLRDPARARSLIEQARRDCAARYSWDAAREHWKGLYHRLAGESGIAVPLVETVRE